MDHSVTIRIGGDVSGTALSRVTSSPGRRRSFATPGAGWPTWPGWSREIRGLTGPW